MIQPILTFVVMEDDRVIGVISGYKTQLPALLAECIRCEMDPENDIPAAGIGIFSSTNHEGQSTFTTEIVRDGDCDMVEFTIQLVGLYRR